MSKVLAAVAFATSTLFVLIWLKDFADFLDPLRVSTRLNASLALFVLSASLLLQLYAPILRRRHIDRGAQVLAALVFVLALVTLAQHLFGWHAFLDDWLVASSFKENYAPNAARICLASTWLLLASSAALFCMPLPGVRGFFPDQILAIGVAAVSLSALVGKAYGLDADCRIGSLVRTSPFSALSFLILSMGTLLARPERGFMPFLTNSQIGGKISRKLLIPALLLPPFMGWIEHLGRVEGGLGSAESEVFAVMGYIGVFLLLIFLNSRMLNRTETQRVRAEQNLQSAMEASAVGLWKTDVKKRLSVADARFCKILGLNKEENVERTQDFVLRIHPEDRDRAVWAFEKAIRQRCLYDEEIRILRPDGQIRWIRDRGQLVEGEAGSKWMAGAAVDITDLKHTEIENAALLAREQEAVKARDEFLSIASHELKTPLTSLKLQTQMHMRNMGRGDPQALAPDRMLRMIEANDRQIDRLTRLIDDMLDISRINSGKLSLQVEIINLSELIRDVAERMAPQFVAAGCELKVDCDPALQGQWDRFRIEQVLMNVLSNSIKYGAGKPVEISVLKKEPSVRMRVRDYGIGIAPENQERIFQRFERAGPNIPGTGLGLGLYIVREILKMHRGSIHVESQLGEGSVFVIDLPSKLFRGVA